MIGHSLFACASWCGVCGLNCAWQYAKGDGLLAKQELEVPDEVKLAQVEVELTPAFMTKSGGPYKCPP